MTTVTARAPARVKIIGEHTDYNEGFTLPMALPFDTVIAARSAGDPDTGPVTIVSEGFGTVALDPAADPTDAPEWARHLDGLRRREPFQDFVYRRYGSDGARWAKVSGLPVFGADGQFRGYRGTATDVTAEVEAREARAIAGRQFRLASRQSPCLAQRQPRVALLGVVHFAAWLTVMPLLPVQVTMVACTLAMSE